MFKIQINFIKKEEYKTFLFSILSQIFLKFFNFLWGFLFLKTITHRWNYFIFSIWIRHFFNHFRSSFKDDMNRYLFNESSKFLKLHIELILRDICNIKLLGSHTKIREEKLLLERTGLKSKMYDFRDFVDITLVD